MAHAFLGAGALDRQDSLGAVTHEFRPESRCAPYPVCRIKLDHTRTFPLLPISCIVPLNPLINQK